MTPNTSAHPSVDGREVTEADREAAAKVFDTRSRKAAHPATITMERHHAKVIRAGEGDDYDAVQAALLSRLTSTAALQERIAELEAAVSSMPVDADYANAEAFRDAVNEWWDHCFATLTKGATA